MLVLLIIIFFIVVVGFYEIMLVILFFELKSVWGLGVMDIMLWYGIGGVLLLVMIVGMIIWRGF